MKIAYFINTFKSINWGGQATSEGIKQMLLQTYPDALFTPLDLPSLPFKKIKILRSFYERKLVQSILNDDIDMLKYYLEKMNVSHTIFNDFSHICFNGEGAVHLKSGHIRLFMGLLYLAKSQHKTVAAINQTVDTKGDKILEVLITKVYNMIDFVSVREPVSYDYVRSIGVKNVRLIPDAVYGLKKMSKEEIDKRTSKYILPENYIAFTGSSALKKNRKSLKKVAKILSCLQKSIKAPIVFMANAKTDIWLAHRLQKQFGLIIVKPPTKYDDAMAIIAKAQMLIGGRQHPNIFAYIYHTPYIPFKGNTFKNEGVAKLQKYPISPLSWDTDELTLQKTIEQVQKVRFNDIVISEFNIFNKNQKETV